MAKKSMLATHWQGLDDDTTLHYKSRPFIFNKMLGLFLVLCHIIFKHFSQVLEDIKM